MSKKRSPRQPEARPDVEKQLEEILRGVREMQARQAPRPKGRAPKFSHYAERWFAKYARTGKKPGTLAHRRNYLRLYLLPPLRRRRVDEINSGAIDAVKDHMDALKSQTRNEALIVLSMILREAQEEGWIERLPRITLEAVVRVERRSHELDVYRLIVRAAKRLGWRHHLAVLLCGDAGLRASEVAGLEWVRVRLDDRAIDVVAQAYKGRLIPPKGNRARSVPMTDDLFDALSRAKKRAKTARVVPGAVKPAIDGGSITWLVVEAAEAANQSPKGGAHIFRHTAASHALDAGATITAVQEILGHKRPTTTEKYLHASTRTVQDAARLLSAMRRGDKK